MNNSQMGFFKGEPGNNPVPQLYYDNGNLFLSGTVYAANGWFGDSRGWIIGDGLTGDDVGSLAYTDNEGVSKKYSLFASGETKTDLGGLLYSANGKVILTTGTDSTPPRIVISSNGFTSDYSRANAALVFDGNNLYVNGTITSTSGSIGGWTIGSDYLGNGTTLANSSIGFHINTGNNVVLWAGSTTRGSASFRVTANGKLISTSGSIGGWTIGATRLSAGSSTNAVGLDSGTANFDYAIWAGHETASSAPFSVKRNGTLYASGATIAGNTSITASSVNITGTGNSAFNVNMTNFQIDSSGNVIITGKVQATSGYIGTNSTNGWTIDSNTIRHGATNSTTSGDIAISASTFTRSINNTSRNNLQLAIGSKFGVQNDGTLYASGAAISGAITATSLNVGNQTADNWAKTLVEAYGYDTVANVNDKLSNYTKTADIVIDSALGIARMGAHRTDNLTGKIFSGANISLDSSGYLTLASISGSGDIAKLTMSDGWIVLSSTNNNSLNASSNVKIGPSKVSINSSGTFDVSATNFIINSQATGNNTMFQVGSTSDSYIKYTPNGGLVIKGGITATSIDLSNTTIPASDISGLATVATTGSYNSLTNQPAAVGYIAAYFDSNGVLHKGTVSSGSNGFQISTNGLLQASNATIYGTIYASAGEIGGCSIQNGTLKVGSANITSISASLIQAVEISADKITSGTLSGRAINNGNGTFTVDGNGHLHATSADISGDVSFSGNISTSAFSVSGGTITGFSPTNGLVDWQQISGVVFDNTCAGNGALSDGHLGNEIFFKGAAKFSFNNSDGALIGYSRFAPNNGTVLRLGTWGTPSDVSPAKGGYFQFSVTPENINGIIYGKIFVHWLREYDGSSVSNGTLVWGDFTSNYWQ